MQGFLFRMSNCPLLQGFVLALSCLILGAEGRSQQASREDPDKIGFYLWTRSTPLSSPVKVELTADSLLASGYRPDHPTVILSHGFTSEGISFGQPFAEALLQADDYNVFTVEWSHYANWTNYFAAAANTRLVGEHSANLVALLANNGGIGNLHVVGHSLGAHVAGFLGAEVQALGYGKVPRITGLDPAQPAFELAGTSGRLDEGDADFVDVIHTNSGMLWEGCLSMAFQVGHMDFYPSGGKHQPGCTDVCVGGTCTDNNINDLIRGGCSHSRANSYFVESVLAHVTGTRFLAWHCASWEDFTAGLCCGGEMAEMGLNIQRGSEGKYFLYANEEEPFAVGDYCI